MPRDLHDEIAETPHEFDDLHKIRVRLPLPLNVSAQLMRAVGCLWPDAKILPAGSAEMVFGIPDTIADVTDEQLEACADDTDDGGAMIQAFTPGRLNIAPGHELALFLADGLADAFPPEAVNYIEMPLVDGRTIVVLRRHGASPHQLRQIAEDRVAQLEQQLTDAGIEPVAAKPASWYVLDADREWLVDRLETAGELKGKERTQYLAALRTVIDEMTEDRRAALARRVTMPAKTRTALKLETP